MNTDVRSVCCFLPMITTFYFLNIIECTIGFCYTVRRSFAVWSMHNSSCFYFIFTQIICVKILINIFTIYTEWFFCYSTHYSSIYKVLHCRVTNSQLEHTTTRILGLHVPNLQILIMEWENVDFQITQFSERIAITEKSNFPPFSHLLLIQCGHVLT